MRKQTLWYLWMKVPCELFTYFSTTFHPNRFMFSFRSVTRHDHQSRSCHRWDWSWKPRSKPVLVLLVGRWHQTNKQESKWNSHMVHYGILWPLCLKSPCMNCTVRVMVWRFYVQVGQPQHLWRFLLDNVFVSVRYPRWFLHTEMSSVPEGVQ